MAIILATKLVDLLVKRITLKFDRMMRKTNGSISGIKLLVNESPVIYNKLSSPFHEMKVNINESHKIWGHHGSYKLEKTANIHDLKLNGEFKTCESVPLLNLDRRTWTKTGRVEIESLVSDYTWILASLIA
jgi:hypothetical protein